MTIYQSTPGVARLLIIGATLVIIIAGIKNVASLLNIILLSIVFALICSPLLQWLRRKGAPDWLAVLVTVSIFLVVLLIFVTVVAVSISQFSDNLPSYQARIDEITVNIAGLLAGVGIDLSAITDLAALDAERVVDFAVGLAAGVGGALSNGFVILLTFIFLLLDTLNLPAKVEKAFGAGSPVVSQFSRFTAGVREYMLDKTGLGLLAATGDVILLLIMGVDFALLWGVIAFLFSYIPTIGFWFALIPPTLMALLQFGWQEALIVLIGYVIINTLVDNVISPKIMGSDLNISTLVVFLSLIVWGWILGGVGAILAVPLTLMVMFILASFNGSRWLAVLMSEDGDFGTKE